MTWRGWEDYVPPIRNAPQPPPPAKQKYGAVKTTIDGITFDSKREADRYVELRMFEKVGAIVGLELQPRYPLNVITSGDGEPAGFSVQIGVYVADFRYVTGREGVVVEDVKGFKTPLYRWKKKHVEAQYGISILET